LGLTTVTAAYYLGISKRLNEYKSSSAIRPVLEKYDISYLKDLSVMFQTLTITFYSLWVVNYTGPLDVNILRITIVMVILILIYYKHIIIESDLSNPVDIVYSHKTLLFFIAMYVLLILASMFPKFVTGLYFGCN
ncbi:hypothetical protein IJT10_00900, partial [bacterium]|nr:hypothetical protein [bacterium]